MVMHTTQSYLKENPDSSANAGNRPSQEEQYCIVLMEDNHTRLLDANDIKQNTCTVTMIIY